MAKKRSAAGDQQLLTISLRPWPASSVFQFSDDPWKWATGWKNRHLFIPPCHTDLHTSHLKWGEFPPHFKCENIFNLKSVSRIHHVRWFMPCEMWLLCHLLSDSSHGSSQGFEDRQMHLTSQIMKSQRRISSEFLLALPRNPQSSKVEGLLICANNQSSNFLSIPLNKKLHQTFQT